MKRIQFFSTTGLLTTMEDANAIELSYPQILDRIKTLFPDEVVWFWTISLDGVEVCTVYLF